MNLIIPAKMNDKLTYFLSEFKKTEWSGPAWYTVIKSDKKGFPKTWKLVHFVPIDLGHSAATEFSAKALVKTIKKFYKEMPQLSKCYLGLIHSHHSMGAYYSGTDEDTMIDNAPNEGFYGSLVVASSGKEGYAFAFSYLDQYDKPTVIELEEDKIDVEVLTKVPEAWTKEAKEIRRKSTIKKKADAKAKETSQGTFGWRYSNGQQSPTKTEIIESAVFANKRLNQPVTEVAAKENSLTVAQEADMEDLEAAYLANEITFEQYKYECKNQFGIDPVMYYGGF